MANCAPAANRTRSLVYARGQVSSKSLTPQISRPSESRHVPKFSTCRSPTASTWGASSQIAAHFRPELRPAIIGRAEKREQRGRHHVVLQLQIRLDDGQLRGEPFFVAPGGLQDVHHGRDYTSRGVSIHFRTPRGAPEKLSWSMHTRAAFFRSICSAEVPSRNATVMPSSGWWPESSRAFSR